MLSETPKIWLENNAKKYTVNGLEETHKYFDQLILKDDKEKEFIWKLFKHWMIGAVAIAHNTLESRIELQGMLVFCTSATNKLDSLCEDLLPPDRICWYGFVGDYAIDKSYLPVDFVGTERWISKFSNICKSGAASFLSQPVDEYKLDCKGNVETRPRVTTYLTITDNIKMLGGEKWNRRYWPIRVVNVQRKHIDICKVWAEVYNAWQTGSEVHWQTTEEIEYLHQYVQKITK